MQISLLIFVVIFAGNVNSLSPLPALHSNLLISFPTESSIIIPDFLLQSFPSQYPTRMVF